MARSRHIAQLVVLAALLVIAPLGVQAEDRLPVEPAVPKAVDLVICLDTSGSMQGLINAARQKLWSVVSQLATAKPTPDLRVALLTYGSPGNDDTGHVVLQADLTRDLDLISEKLFALTTRGGDEYVGRVVAHALEHLNWGARDTVRILFVAGNESADQDRVKPFRDQAGLAKERGIVVNAVYCGGADDDDAGGYRELASLGAGRFAYINHNHGTVAVKTPFDAELTQLSAKVNKTYVAYGAVARESLRRQFEQDANAEASGGAPAAAERASAKAGRLYRNASWDLVDRMAAEGFDLAEIPVEDLPEDMRTMTVEQRLAHLQAMKKERAGIQARIKELSKKRDAYVRTEMDRQQLDDSQALDRALKDAIRDQAGRGGFEFPGK